MSFRGKKQKKIITGKTKKFFKTYIFAATKTRVIPYIKWDESHTYVISLFKLCLTPFKSFWTTPYKYWSCLPSPGMVSLTAHPLVQTLIASWWHKIVFSQLSKRTNCESPSWSCGWGLIEQTNSFLIISSHLFVTYRDLQSFTNKGIRPIHVHTSHRPQTLREAQRAYLEVSKLQRAPWHVPKSCHPWPLWPRRHMIHLEQRAPCYCCWHWLIRLIFLLISKPWQCKSPDFAGAWRWSFPREWFRKSLVTSCHIHSW